MIAPLDFPRPDASRRTELGNVFFENVILYCPTQLRWRDTLFFSHDNVHGYGNSGGGRNRHGRADLMQWNTIKQHFHVRQRTDRDSTLADLTRSHGMIGIVA